MIYKKNMRFLYIILAVLLCALVLFVSLSKDFATAPNVLYLDKLIHFVGYGLVSFCAVLFFPDRRMRFLSVCGIFLLSIFAEVLQHFSSERTASLTDVLANFSGVLAGALVALALHWLYKKRMSPKGLALLVFNYLRKL